MESSGTLPPVTLRILAAVSAGAGLAAAGLLHANRHSARLDAGLPRRVVLPPELAAMAKGLATTHVPARPGELEVKIPEAPAVPEDPAYRLPLWLASLAGIGVALAGGAVTVAGLLGLAAAPSPAPGRAVGLGLAAGAAAAATAAVALPMTRRYLAGPFPDAWEVAEYDRALGRRADYVKRLVKYRAFVDSVKNLHTSPVDTPRIYADHAIRLGDDTLQVQFYRRGTATVPCDVIAIGPAALAGRGDPLAPAPLAPGPARGYWGVVGDARDYSGAVGDGSGSDTDE